jgi:hypothetical protein
VLQDCGGGAVRAEKRGGEEEEGGMRRRGQTASDSGRMVKNGSDVKEKATKKNEQMGWCKGCFGVPFT